MEAKPFVPAPPPAAAKPSVKPAPAADKPADTTATSSTTSTTRSKRAKRPPLPPQFYVAAALVAVILGLLVVTALGWMWGLIVIGAALLGALALWITGGLRRRRNAGARGGFNPLSWLTGGSNGRSPAGGGGGKRGLLSRLTGGKLGGKGRGSGGGGAAGGKRGGLLSKLTGGKLGGKGRGAGGKGPGGGGRHSGGGGLLSGLNPFRRRNAKAKGANGGPANSGAPQTNGKTSKKGKKKDGVIGDVKELAGGFKEGWNRAFGGDGKKKDKGKDKGSKGPGPGASTDGSKPTPAAGAGKATGNTDSSTPKPASEPKDGKRDQQAPQPQKVPKPQQAAGRTAGGNSKVSAAAAQEGISLQGYGMKIPHLAGMSDDDSVRMAKVAADLGPLHPAVKENIASVARFRATAREVDASVARLQGRLADGTLTRDQRRLIDAQIEEGKKTSNDLRAKANVTASETLGLYNSLHEIDDARAKRGRREEERTDVTAARRDGVS